ncbi:alpha/beta fold hydrolase [Streptomyces carpinensis]|uniref:Alpha/beta hydrolase n=1 Tax=Streptomyces carpinensis TaxID=66369 RepID=A0ABV1W079_9ACTN|nr:alpha/beta hydrolase [Streptomyces carpinensis]
MTTRRPAPLSGATRVTRADGTSLAYEDHTPRLTSPPGPPGPVLLLHGLAGHRGEWDDLAARLRTAGHRAVTYDARGHGESTRRPRDVTREAHVADAAALINDLSLAPATVIGQSMGGHTALLLAAAHPDLVKSLILIEAGPAVVPPNVPKDIENWLDSWPTPFPSFEAATDFLSHEAWASGLEEREDGWWPRVDKDVMVASIRELTKRDYWPEWAELTCPTLVVRGENGTMRKEEFTEMHSRRPGTTRLVTVPDAGHDVHLDQPTRLYEAVQAFLGATPSPSVP